MSFTLIVEPLLHLGLKQTCLIGEHSAATRHTAISFESAQQHILHTFRVAESLDGATGPELPNQCFLSAQILRRYVLHALFTDEFRMHFFRHSSKQGKWSLREDSVSTKQGKWSLREDSVNIINISLKVCFRFFDFLHKNL